jgi:cysteinyl-tRNA synthetase, unknown class
MRLISPLLLAALLASALPLAAAEPAAPANPLKHVHSWMYQLQNMEDPAAMDRLAASPYDLLVIEPTFTLKEQSDFDAKALVAKLKAARPGRVVLAYVDIGEAERFRSYWDKSWQLPTKTAHASPSFLLAPDPDGWKDDVSIAFWDPQWQNLWLGEDGLIKKIAAAGFDGIYMDWVDAYDEDKVTAEARRQHQDPARAMVDYIAAIRQQLRRENPRAVVVAQNAAGLIDADPRYAGLIDGIALEDTWFHGKADSPWDSPKGGDIPNRSREDDSTAGRLEQYKKYLQAGIPVFTVDYCLKPGNAAQVYRDAAQAGLIPLVTRVSLERLTTTPPPGLVTPAP